MSQSISTAFVKQFESEVHVAFQRMGSKLRSLVRQKSNIKGQDTTFQKVGKGTATSKTRHGLVPTMSLDHTQITVTLADYYAAEYVDKFDELKIQHDERGVVTQALAAAMGRKSDDLLITAAETTSNTVSEVGTTGLVTSSARTKIETVYEYFGNNDIPNDGQRYFAVSPGAFTDLLSQASYASSDYVQGEELPFKGGMLAKRWMSFMWFEHSGLNVTASIRNNLAFYKTALGFASGAEVQTEAVWESQRHATFIKAAMSQGACLIDTTGVYKVQAYDA